MVSLLEDLGSILIIHCLTNGKMWISFENVKCQC